MKMFKKYLAMILVIFTITSMCSAVEPRSEFINNITPTGRLGTFASPFAIDDIKVIQGSPQFYEEGKGAYYYAYSYSSDKYSEAFANIKLPTALNNAGNTRNAYISLGICAPNGFGIDLGIKNEGSGWYPCSLDVGDPDTRPNKKFKEWPQYKAPSTATNATIVVKPINNTTVNMYIDWLNSSGNSVGTPVYLNIPTVLRDYSSNNGSMTCRFYRFASFVPKGIDNQKDSSYMLGGQFLTLGLYNKSSARYENWGIKTGLMQHAWIRSPERLTLSYTTNRDTFKIDHWANA